jgi:GT2 family glycosyltransferase
MWTKTFEENVSVYSNEECIHPFNIVDRFSCKIPVKLPSDITSIKLFFGTYQKICQGTLFIKIEVDSSPDHTLFTIPIKDIQDNAPLELTFDKPKFASKDLSVYIKADYSSQDTIAVWVNRVGICAVVKGEISKEYSFKYYPKISIITPVYKTKLTFLKGAVESVLGQLYDKWELILVDDFSNDPEITNYLKDLSNLNGVKVISNSTNLGIAAATNIGIDRASGEFITFLDHDDLLDISALLKIVSYINSDPSTDLVYTDEDKVTEDGVHFAHFYKPDWNYNMLLSQMYTCHLSVYRGSILKKIGGIREGYDGSQDYDLVLRFIEETRRIGHVPEVLYHWRSCPGSTSQSIQNKPQARINAVRAISEHLSRVGTEALVYAGPFQGHYHVDYTLKEEPLVSIVIPFKDNVTYLKNLFYTMGLTSYKNYEIILVSNNSVEEDTFNFLNSVKDRVSIIYYDYPFNFSAINNFAVRSKECRGDLVLFLNNDTEVMHPEWLTELVKQFTLEKVSIVGGKLLYLNHQIQHAGIFVGVNGVAGHSHKKMYDYMPGYFSRPHIVQEITAVTGACMMVKKEVFLGLGGFDEGLPKAFNDVDLCLKARKEGHLIVYTPYCRVYHLESMSRGLDSLSDPGFKEAIHKMEDRWGVFSFKDPYYNPNLPTNCEVGRWA